MTIKKKKLLLFLGVALLAVAAIIIRLLAIHMYDLHIDEITYARFAQTIDAGELPRNFDGSAFFLHPPGYFAMLAVWRAIFWHGGNIFAQYTVLRTLNIFLAGLSVLSMFAITKVVTRSNKLGLLAGALFTIDPFLIRQNTRSLMETATMLWLLLGFWLLLRYAGKPATNKWLWLSIGFIFGLAMVTKDVATNFLVLMFALMAIRRVGPEKRTFHYIIPAAIAPYGVWLAIVAISGYTSIFISQKTVGIRRFFGLVQTTGFNSSTGPSKDGTLLQTIPHYASSYGIMGLGAVASFLLLFSKDPNRRRWGCIGTAATILLGYLYVGGTFEEQYLYYMMVPSIISIIVGFVELMHVLPGTYRRLLKVLAAVSLIGIMGFSIASYTMNVSKPSTGWQTTIDWVNSNIPANSTICVFGQGQFLLTSRSFNVCDWGSLTDIQAHHVQYVIVSDKLTYSNYEPLSPSAYAQVKKDSTVAFSTYSPDSGEFKVIKIDSPSTPVYELPPAPKNVATFPKQATTATASSVATIAAPTTLPNTGSSVASSFRVFLTTMSVGMAIAYLFFYLRNRGVRKEGQIAFSRSYALREQIVPAQYVGSLALQGERPW